jgi:hypothetical protein
MLQLQLAGSGQLVRRFFDSVSIYTRSELSILRAAAFAYALKYCPHYRA